MSKKKKIGVTTLLIAMPFVAAGITVGLTYNKNNEKPGIASINSKISRTTGLELIIKGKNLSKNINDYSISIEGIPMDQKIDWWVDIENSTSDKVLIITNFIDANCIGKKIKITIDDQTIIATYPEVPTYTNLKLVPDFKDSNNLKVRLEYIGKYLPLNSNLYKITIDGSESKVDWTFDVNNSTSEKIVFVSKYNPDFIGKSVEVKNQDSQNPNDSIPTQTYPSISQISSYEIFQDQTTSKVRIKIEGKNLNQDLDNYTITLNNNDVNVNDWTLVSKTNESIVLENKFDFNLVNTKCLVSVNDGFANQIDVIYPATFDLSILNNTITTEFLEGIEQNVANFTYKNEFTLDIKDNLNNKVQEELNKISNVNVDSLEIEWKEIDPANGLLKLSLKFKFNCEIKQGNYSNFTIDQNDPTTIVLNKEFDTKVNKHLNDEGILTLSDDVLTKINEKLNTFSNSLTNDVKPTSDELNNVAQELQTTIGDFYPTISINLQGDNFQNTTTSNLFRQIKYIINFENVQGVSLPSNSQSFTLDNNNQDLISPILDTKVKGYLSLDGNEITINKEIIDSINSKFRELIAQYWINDSANIDVGIDKKNWSVILNELNSLLPNDFPGEFYELHQWTGAWGKPQNGKKTRQLTLTVVLKGSSKTLKLIIDGTDIDGWTIQEYKNKYYLTSPEVATGVNA